MLGVEGRIHGTNSCIDMRTLGGQFVQGCPVGCTLTFDGVACFSHVGPRPGVSAMNKHRTNRTGAACLAVALLVMCAPASHAQEGKRGPLPFQIIEASIDDIQSAYKAGTLTAHQLVQAYLARIDAYDKNGPKINSI